jgi:DNA-binding winged helix-turn-helix (wHTH) protein
MVNVFIVSADSVFARVLSRSMGDLCEKTSLPDLSQASYRVGALYVLDLRAAASPEFSLEQFHSLGLSARNVIVLVRSNPLIRAQCLRAGCALVLEDPFDPFELRSFIEGFAPQADSSVQVGNVTLKPSLLQAYLNSRDLGLSPTEFRILMTLAEHRSERVSREFIRKQVWGQDFAIADRSIDSNVSRIRLKLKDSSLRILSGRKQGYLLQVEPLESRLVAFSQKPPG